MYNMLPFVVTPAPTNVGGDAPTICCAIQTVLSSGATGNVEENVTALSPLVANKPNVK